MELALRFSEFCANRFTTDVSVKPILPVFNGQDFQKQSIRLVRRDKSNYAVKQPKIAKV